MPKPKTLPEAVKALRELRSSLEGIEEFFSDYRGMIDRLNLMNGEASAKSAAVKEDVKGAGLPGIGVGKEITTVDRVLAIIRESKSPLTPKAVVMEYHKRSYPPPKSGTLYNLIGGTLAYLYKRKKVIDKTEEGGYQIAA